MTKIYYTIYLMKIKKYIDYENIFPKYTIDCKYFSN